MSPNAKKYLKLAILILTIVAGLGPTVTELAGALPPTWVSVLSRIVSLAGALQLWLSESPLVQPFLSTKTPSEVIDAAKERAAKDDSEKTLS